ncbi:MAG: SOS response-associated peptidase family protein [Pseudomonadota bacterium]
MTHLVRIDCSAADIAKAFGAAASDDPWGGGYAAPGRFAPVVTAGRDFIAGPKPAGRPLRPRIAPRLWGVLPPPNADDPTRRIASVRNTKSPFWIGNLSNSEFRCILPATRIMLWGSETDYEGRRLKHWFAPKDGGVFGLAGVWKDEDVPAFALITRPAQGAPRALGCASMPLVLPCAGRPSNEWLHGERGKAFALLDHSQNDALVELDPPSD